MADIELRRFPPEQLGQIRQILARVVQSLPEAERTSAIISCLAHTILKLVATGESNPASLERVALAKIRDECPNCKGCEGLHSVEKVTEASALEVKTTTPLDIFVREENINLYQKLLAEVAPGSERQSIIMKLLATEKSKG